MIADPININHTSFHLLCLDNIGSDIFVCGSSGDDLIFCSFIKIGPATTDFRVTDNCFLFRAQHYLDEFEFIINGNECSRENWIDKLKIDYPDHFNWFLFHPEYFS